MLFNPLIIYYNVWLWVTPACNQITAVIQWHVIPLVSPGLNNKWPAPLLETLECAGEKYSPWHWYPCFPSTPLSHHRERESSQHFTQVADKWGHAVQIWVFPTRWSLCSVNSRSAVLGRWPWTCVRWLDGHVSGRRHAAGEARCALGTLAPHCRWLPRLSRRDTSLSESKRVQRVSGGNSHTQHYRW